MEGELVVPGDTRWRPHPGALNRDGRHFEQLSMSGQEWRWCLTLWSETVLESGSLSNLVCEQVEPAETRSPIRAVTAQGIEMFLVLDASKSNIGPCPASNYLSQC